MSPNSNVPIQIIHEDIVSSAIFNSAFLIIGIVKSANDSLFSYPFGKNWSSYYLFQYMNQHSLTPALIEILANFIYQGDSFCLYDIAACYTEHSNRTGNTARGTRLGASNRVASTG